MPTSSGVVVDSGVVTVGVVESGVVDPGVVAEGVVSLGGFVLHAVKRQGNTSAATNKSKSSF